MKMNMKMNCCETKLQTEIYLQSPRTVEAVITEAEL